MLKVINIKGSDALKKITEYKYKLFAMHDVRLENVHMKRINALINYNLFSKNDLFINSTSLWELMQPQGNRGSHNYHNLSPEEVLDALNNIVSPYCIFKTKQDRLSIVLSCVCHKGNPLMAVVEVGVGLIDNEDAKINKLVSLYPKSDIDKVVNKLQPNELLYINKL